MEDSSLNHQNGAQLGQSQPDAAGNNKPVENSPKYSIPGVLHFIQHEWARFELERSQWEVDKAELQVKCIEQRTISKTLRTLAECRKTYK